MLRSMPAFYASLCDVAREHGYALTVHGSLISDLDLVAVPWVDAAKPAEVLMQAMLDRVKAVDHRGLLNRDCTWATPAEVEQMVTQEQERIGEDLCPFGGKRKPHGRRAWNRYLEHGCKIDLSVMPCVVPVDHTGQDG